MNTTHVPAGFVTTTDDVLCVECSQHQDLPAFRVGTPDAPIFHPAPNGVYSPTRHSDRYDSPCAICGWAIR